MCSEGDRFCRVDNTNALADCFFNDTTKNRIVSTAENKGIDIVLYYLCQILPGNQFCRGMIDKALLGERDKKRAGLRDNLYFLIDLVDGQTVGI